MAEHTPGPWRVERSPNRRVLCVFGGESFATWICGELQADNETRIDTGECLANAHLVAAAPEMLAALEQLHSFVAVMVGRGEDATIPETISTPLGAPVKIGVIMRAAGAAIAKAGSIGIRE